MDDMKRLVEEDLGVISLPGDAELAMVAELANRQLELEAKVEAAEKELSMLKTELDTLRDKTLSDLLMGLGLTQVKLTNGRKVTVNKQVYASIANERKSAAMAWLIGHGFGALIKSAVILDAGKGGTKKTLQLEALATELGIEIKRKDEVHPMTLRAFVAEQLDKGTGVPQDLFGVHVIFRSKIE